MPIKKIVANNLTELRKEKGLTQFQLAQIFHYSDKAVSKWECGDTLPDLETLVSLADFYGVTLDYLTHGGTRKDKQDMIKPQPKKTIFSKPVMVLLSCMIPLLVSALVYFILYASISLNYYVAFVWWLPVAFLLMFIFSWIWNKRIARSIFAICMVWTLLLSIYLQFGFSLINGYDYWPIFFIGIPLTIASVLWAVLRRDIDISKKKDQPSEAEESPNNEQ